MALVLLITAIAVFAALLVCHASLLLAVFRAGAAKASDTHISGAAKALAFFPPALPFVAWRVGRRKSVGLWLLLLITYIVVRVLGG